LGCVKLQNLQLQADDWIIFTAADLPFGFSDLEAFLRLQMETKDCLLFVGSKAHPQSQVKRNWKRQLGSLVFQAMRTFFLNLKTKDPQGTLFLRGDQLQIAAGIQSQDYFFTTELVYLMEHKTQVMEMPVQLEADLRQSKVRFLKDGFRVLKQTIALKKRLKQRPVERN
jgi:hypothetical protein